MPTMAAASSPAWQLELELLSADGNLRSQADLHAALPARFSCNVVGVDGPQQGWLPGIRRLALNKEMLAARRRIEAGSSVSGIVHRVTDLPRRFRRAWKRIGASPREMIWIVDGVSIARTESCATMTVAEVLLVHNHPGAAGPSATAAWAWSAVLEALAVGAVEAYLPGYGPLLCAPVDVVPKGDYDPDCPLLRYRLRLVIDLRANNLSAVPKPFRMETLHRCRDIFRKGSWLLIYDLQHGYNHFSMAPSERDRMGFRMGSWPLGTEPAPGGRFGRRYDAGGDEIPLPRFYRYAAMPFGHSASPWVFTMLMRVVLRYLRARGVVGIGYIDDFGFVCSSRAQAVQLDRLVRHLFASLGLAINLAKSSDEPTQRAKILGIIVDTLNGTFSISAKRARKVAACCAELLATAAAGEPVRLRLLASVTGKIMSCRIAVGVSTSLRTRACYRLIAEGTGRDPDVVSGRRDLRVAWGASGPLSAAACAELEYWGRTIGTLPPMPIAHTVDPLTIFSGAPRIFQDASDSAFGGAFLDGAAPALAFAPLPPTVCLASSTVRELTGILGTLRSFETDLCGRGDVHVFTDNDEAVRALTVGSRTESVHDVALAVLAWAAAHGCRVHAHWMRRSQGPISLCDFMSKATALQDFRLLPHVFALVERWAGPHTIDAVASSVATSQLPRFWSRFPTPGSAGQDCFARSWAREHVFVYPPWEMVARVLTHAHDSAASGTALVPVDPFATWWPQVQNGAEGIIRHWRFAKCRGLITKAADPVTPSTDLLFVRFDYRSLARH